MHDLESQIAGRGIRDDRVLEALRAVPRDRFVPDEQVPHAWEDRALRIGHFQTISQPYIVAFMTEAARLRPGDRVLEIGTGSGYQAAVLSEIVGEVLSIEIVGELAARARRNLEACGYTEVTVRTGDGTAGWPERAPFDAILVTAAPERIPAALLEQLAEGGRLVAPVGTDEQTIVRAVRTADGLTTEELLPVRFVPMTGAARESTDRA